MPPPPIHSHRPGALLALALLVPAPSLGALCAMAWEPTRGTPLGQAIYAFSKLWILILPLAWALLVDRQRPALSPPKRDGLLVGGLLGILIAAGIIIAYGFVPAGWIDLPAVRDAAGRNGLGTSARYIGLALALTFINSLLEEYVWRWFVYRKCEAIWSGGPIAVILSGLFFTLHHVVALRMQFGWGVTLMGSAGVFIGGCTWSWLCLRYKSIWPGWLSHILADMAVFLVGWHMLFGDAATITP